MTTLFDYYLATLWGGHIGDAFWAPYETRSALEVERLLEPKGPRFPGSFAEAEVRLSIPSRLLCTLC